MRYNDLPPSEIKRLLSLFNCHSLIRIAVSVYMLVAILKKRLDLKLSLSTILPIPSVILFEKTPLFPMPNNSENTLHPQPNANQLNLFSY